eukprot:m.705494 g.705494  ORF g.705494 m.705494 type:complete len:67 (+) comp58723_c0_seq44:491-691(+)
MSATVEMTTAEAALKAVEYMDGAQIDGQSVTVELVDPRRRSPVWSRSYRGRGWGCMFMILIFISLE